MPTIATFYGIIIMMRPRNKEHNPPHIHAFYGEYAGLFHISDGELHEGELPSKAQALVKEFIDDNRTELLDMWETQNFRKLPPLE